MKDNRPVRQQVEELTDEQKAMLPKIHRNRTIILLLILMAMLAVFLYATISCNRAEKQYDALCAQSDKNITQGIFDQELIDARLYAKQLYEHALHRQVILICTSFFCGIAGMVVCFFYYRTSYPFYSTRCYRYLCKQDPPTA